MGEIGSGGWLAIVAIITTVQTIVLAVLGGYINSRQQRQTQEGLEAVEKAKTEHNESTMRLIREARSTRNEVSDVGRVAEETLGAARDIQGTLNGKTKQLLLSIAKLTERLAKDHPGDKEAQADALDARKNYDKECG